MKHPTSICSKIKESLYNFKNLLVSIPRFDQCNSYGLCTIYKYHSLILWLSNFTFTFHFHALEKEMATHSSVLAWKIPGTGEPGGLPSVGLHRVGHDWSDLAAAAAAAATSTLHKRSHWTLEIYWQTYRTCIYQSGGNW